MGRVGRFFSHLFEITLVEEFRSLRESQCELWFSPLRLRSPEALREMERSLSRHGQLVAVVCHRQDEKVEVVDGFKRLIGARALGWSALRAEVHEVTGPAAKLLLWQSNARQALSDLEGRLLAMLENVPNLTLDALNHATQAWVEMEYNRARHSEIGEAPAERERFLRGPSVGRPSPSGEELRLAFRIEETRTQRRSDGTVSIEGVRFEVPSRYRHMERLSVRYASWDLGRVHLVDPRMGTLLAALYPLDRGKNADGMRRMLGPVASAPAEENTPPAAKSTEMAPLLRRLIDAYDRAGLPPAYLPKRDAPAVDNPEND